MLSGRVSDSGASGQGFETYHLRVVTLLLESTGQLSRKRWLSPNMTEKLLTGTLSLNTNKNKKLVTLTYLVTRMILSFGTDSLCQTVQIQIRPLLEEQSDQGPHCLHLLKVSHHGRTS